MHHFFNTFKVSEGREDIIIENPDNFKTNESSVPSTNSAHSIMRRKRLPFLPKIQDEAQKKALTNIIRFFALMIVFTLVARGTAGVTLARVDTVMVYSDEIVVSVTASGKVQAASSHNIIVPQGLTIEEVFVVPGQSIKSGEPIARLNPQEVEDGRCRAQNTLDEMQLNLQKLERGQPYNNSGLIHAQNALVWAQQDYDRIKAAGEAAVAQAENTLANAENRLSELRSNGSDPSEITASESVVNEAKAALDIAIQEASTNLEAASRAVETAKINLTAAQQEDSNARQQASDTATQNTLEAEALRLDIQKQQELINTYESIQESIIFSPVDGIVLEVMEGGVKSGETAIAFLASASGGYRAMAQITAVEANRLPLGAQVNISTSQGIYAANENQMGTLLSVSAANSEEYCNIIVKLPDGEWKHGQNVQLEAVISKKLYPSCVPLSALRQGQDGYFVFIMEESSGVLGVENIVRRIPVKLLANNNRVAAIDGALYGDGRIVSWASKLLADGDKVRVRKP